MKIKSINNLIKITKQVKFAWFILDFVNLPAHLESGRTKYQRSIQNVITIFITKSYEIYQSRFRQL